MERLLDYLRWERTRNELANSRQAAERRSVLIRAVYCGPEVLPPCAAPKNCTRVKQDDDSSIVARHRPEQPLKINVSPAASSAPR